MTAIQQVNIWVEAEAFLDGVTDADVEWAARNLDPPQEGDKAIGTLESQMARRLFAAAMRLHAVSRSENVQAFLEHDPEVRAERAIKARRQSQMADILIEICWGLVRDELNGWGEEIRSIVIRKDWAVMNAVPDRNPFKAMLQGM